MFIPPEPFIRVRNEDDSIGEMKCSADEWVASQLVENEAVVYESKGKVGYGLYKSSYLYDGVICQVWDISVDIDNPMEVSLFLGLDGDKIWPARGLITAEQKVEELNAS